MVYLTSGIYPPFAWVIWREHCSWNMAVTNKHIACQSPAKRAVVHIVKE